MKVIERKIQRSLLDAYEALPEEVESITKQTRGLDLDWWIFQRKGRLASNMPSQVNTQMASIYLMPEELSFLIREAALTSWGIGTLKNCKVFGKLDFEQILWRWCEKETPQLMAIRLDLYQRIVQQATYIEKPEKMPPLLYINKIISKLQSGQRMKEAMQEINKEEQGEVDLVPKPSINEDLVVRCCKKIAPYFEMQISLTWIPLLGKNLGLAIQLRFFDELMEVAKNYYGEALR